MVAPRTKADRAVEWILTCAARAASCIFCTPVSLLLAVSLLLGILVAAFVYVICYSLFGRFRREPPCHQHRRVREPTGREFAVVKKKKDSTKRLGLAQ